MKKRLLASFVVLALSVSPAAGAIRYTDTPSELPRLGRKLPEILQAVKRFFGISTDDDLPIPPRP